MKNLFLTCLLFLAAYLCVNATITCNFAIMQLDSNEIQPIDVDGDGQNDYILHATYLPNIQNYITGLNGNEIEVTAGSGINHDRARRIESGDPVGALAWNDTAYMIKGGQGSFSGGSEEYGFVGLRLNKSGSYHYAFLEVRAPYWQAFVAVYTRGYNDVALAETRTDACPHPVGIEDRGVAAAHVFISGKKLHISLQGDVQGSAMQLFNSAGQMVRTENLQQAESAIALNDLTSGVYVVAIMRNENMVLRKKVIVF